MAESKLALGLHPLDVVVQAGDFAQEAVVGWLDLDITQPDDHDDERGVDQAIGFVHREAYRLALALCQVNEGLQAGGDFAEGVDQVSEEFEFHEGNIQH